MSSYIREKKTFVSQTTNNMTDGIMGLSAPFVVGFVLLFIRSALQVTVIVDVPDLVDKVLFLSGILFLTLHYVLNIRSYQKHLFLYIVVLGTAMLSYLRSGQTMPLTFTLTILAAYSIRDIKSVVKLWIVLSVVLLVMTITFYTINYMFAPESLMTFYRYENGLKQVRHAFYFSHPNMFGCMVFMVLGSVLYVSEKRLSLIKSLSIFFVALFVLMTSGSRTSAILIAFLPILFALDQRFSFFERKAIRRVVGLLPIVLFVATYLAAGPLYSPQIGPLLSNRISLWHACLANQGLTVFGQKFEFSYSVAVDGYVSYYDTIDSAYGTGLFVFGLLFCAWFCLAFFLTCGKLNSRDASILPMFVATLLYGITEVHMFNIMLCIPMILISQAAPGQGSLRLRSSLLHASYLSASSESGR